jgi:hypothetical protein
MNLKQSLKIVEVKANIVKLIHRQTGTTTYELETLKSGWKAFGLVLQLVCLINLKSEFVPMNLMKTFDRNHTS